MILLLALLQKDKQDDMSEVEKGSKSRQLGGRVDLAPILKCVPPDKANEAQEKAMKLACFGVSSVVFSDKLFFQRYHDLLKLKR